MVKKTNKLRYQQLQTVKSQNTTQKLHLLNVETQKYVVKIIVIVKSIEKYHIVAGS